MNPPNPPNPPFFRNLQEQQLYERDNANVSPVVRPALFTIAQLFNFMENPSILRNMCESLRLEIRYQPENTPGLAEKQELLSGMLRILDVLDRQRPHGRGGKSRRFRRRSSKKYKKARNSRRHVR